MDKTKDLGFIGIVKYELNHYMTFKGCASRREYWMFTLFIFLLYLVAGMCSVPFFENREMPTFNSIALCLLALFYLIQIPPFLAVTVRRLHDSNKCGGYLFFSGVPYIGGFILLYFLVKASDPNSKYREGNEDKLIEEEEDDLLK